MNSSILKAWHTKWIGKRKAKKKNEIIFVSDILNISHTTKHLNLSHKSNHPNENGENSIRSWKKNNKMVAQPIFMLHPITNHALFFITTPFPHTKKEKKKYNVHGHSDQKRANKRYNNSRCSMGERNGGKIKIENMITSSIVKCALCIQVNCFLRTEKWQKKQKFII